MDFADPVHVSVLNLGVKHWNEWREKNPGIRPQLFETDLRGLRLLGADLSGADLRRAAPGDEHYVSLRPQFQRHAE